MNKIYGHNPFNAVSASLFSKGSPQGPAGGIISMGHLKCSVFFCDSYIIIIITTVQFRIYISRIKFTYYI